MSTGLKWVEALRISCCSGLLGSIWEVSTICGEMPPEGDSTQNGPPPGSPWLRTTPQTRMGRSRASIRKRFRSWGSAWAKPSGSGRQSSLSRKSPASRSTASARFPRPPSLAPLPPPAIQRLQPVEMDEGRLPHRQQAAAQEALPEVDHRLAIVGDDFVDVLEQADVPAVAAELVEVVDQRAVAARTEE